jgi:hypothetical protein
MRNLDVFINQPNTSQSPFARNKSVKERRWEKIEMSSQKEKAFYRMSKKNLPKKSLKKTKNYSIEFNLFGEGFTLSYTIYNRW